MVESPQPAATEPPVDQKFKKLAHDLVVGSALETECWSCGILLRRHDMKIHDFDEGRSLK